MKNILKQNEEQGGKLLSENDAALMNELVNNKELREEYNSKGKLPAKTLRSIYKTTKVSDDVNYKAKNAKTTEDVKNVLSEVSKESAKYALNEKPSGNDAGKLHTSVVNALAAIDRVGEKGLKTKKKSLESIKKKLESDMVKGYQKHQLVNAAKKNDSLGEKARAEIKRRGYTETKKAPAKKKAAPTKKQTKEPTKDKNNPQTQTAEDADIKFDEMKDGDTAINKGKVKESEYSEFFSLPKLFKLVEGKGLKLNIARVSNLIVRGKKANGVAVYDPNTNSIAVYLDKGMLMEGATDITARTKDPLVMVHEIMHVIHHTARALKDAGITSKPLAGLEQNLTRLYNRAINEIITVVEQIQQGKPVKKKGLRDALTLYLNVGQFSQYALGEQEVADMKKKYGKDSLQELKTSALLKALKKALLSPRESTDVDFFGLTNIDEFLSEGLSNPFFINILRNIDATESLRGRKVQTTLLKQMLDFVADTINKVVGLRLGSIINRSKNTLYQELQLIADEAIMDIEAAEEIATVIEGHMELSTSIDEQFAPSNEAKKDIIKRVAQLIVNNQGLGATKQSVTELIENTINKNLDKAARLDEAMIKKVWKAVREANAEGFSGKLSKLLDTKTTVKNRKGLKMGKGVTIERARVINDIKAALKKAAKTNASQKAYDKYLELEEKMGKEGVLSPEDLYTQLLAMITGFKHLGSDTQAAVVKSVKDFVDKGRAELLEQKIKKITEKHNLRTEVINILMGTDAEGKYKSLNPYATYSEGDLVVFNNNIYKLTQDMKGEDIKHGAEGVVRQKGQSIRPTPKQLKKHNRMGWFTILDDSILGLDDVMEVLASNATISKKQYRSALAKLFTYDMRRAGTAEFMNKLRTSELINQGRTKYIGDGSVKKAQERISDMQQEVPSEQLDELIDKYGDEIPLDGVTYDQLVTRWIQLFAPDVKRAYKNKDINPNEIQEDIGKVLPEYAKNWGKFLLGFYSGMYSRINPVYVDVYGTDLTQLDNYSPVISHAAAKAQAESKEFISNLLEGYTTDQVKEVTSTHFMERTGSIPANVSANDLLVSFVDRMEHFIAYAKPVSKLANMVNNETVTNIISQNFGDKYVKMLNNHLSVIAKGKIADNKNDKGVSKFAEKVRTNTVVAALSANLTLFPKQLVSFPAYFVNLDWTSSEPAIYGKYAAEMVANPLAAIKMFLKEDWIQHRIKGGHTRDVSLVANQVNLANLVDKHRKFDYKKLQQFLIDYGMLPTKAGDVAAIITGGYPLYKTRFEQNMKQGMSKKEAHAEAMEDVQRASELTQQSPHLMDLGSMQTGGLFSRIFTMYQSSPFIYKKQITVAARAYNYAVQKHGRNSPQAKLRFKELIKRGIVFHVILPTLFSLASAAFYPPRDEDDNIDWESLIAQGIIGSFTGTPLAGPVLRILYDIIISEKGYRPSMSPLFSALNEALDATVRVTSTAIKGDEFDEYNKKFWDGIDFEFDAKDFRDLAKILAPATGIPLGSGIRTWENIDKGFVSDYEMDYNAYQKVLLAAGYSEYAVPQLKATSIKGKRKSWRKDILK